MGWTLITGASGGIGEAIAAEAARDGEDVVLAARSGEKLRALATRLSAEHGVEAVALPADLSEPGAGERLWDAASEGREIGTLVNNAGLGRYGPFAAGGEAREDQALAVNVAALTALSRRAVAAMKPRGTGRILQIASVAGYLPGPNMAVYNATKAYVVSLSESLAEELRGSGVSVTCVSPGVTGTGFQEGAGMAHLDFVKRAPSQSAEEVGRFAWKAMKRGARVAIPGAANKALVLAVRGAPRGLLARMLGLAMR